jgi:hypothetical protein
MGGRLAIVADFPNRPPVRVKRFNMLAGQTEDLNETTRPSHRRDDAVRGVMRRR